MTEILIYGDIGFEVQPKNITEQLAAASGPVDVRIDSYGGDVYAGIAILNALRRYAGGVTVYVDGMAASAASFIAVGGGDKLIMSPNSSLLIHGAWASAVGNSEELLKLAGDLDKITENLATIYAEKSGLDAAYWRDLMKTDTVFDAEQAVEVGLADGVLEVHRSATAEMQLAVMASARSRFAGRRNDRGVPDIAPAPDTRGENMDLQAFARRLGCADDADEATILAALDEALAEQAADDVPAEEAPAKEEEPSEPVVATDEVPQPEPEPEPEPESDSGEVEPEDEAPQEEESEALVVTIDKKDFELLREQAAYGIAAKARDEHAKLEAQVDAAIKENRISAGARDRWIKAMEADPDGTRERLARIPKDLIPRAEVGHNAASADHTVKTTSAPGFGAVNV